jgi:hypothetical protein
MRRRVAPNRAVALSIAILAALAALTISGVIAATASTTETRSITSSADTQIVENAPTKNYGAATSLGVNGNFPSGSGKDEFALVRWDLSGIAPHTQVSSALVTLNVTTASSQTYQAYVLKKPWVESAATWNVYSSGKPWQVAGAKGSLDREATVAGSITPSVKGKNTLTLPLAVVQGWVDNPATNQGIIIANPSSTRGFNFNSREVADPTRRPQLTLNLSPPQDTTPPETTIDSGPSGTISSGDVSFTFSSSEAGSTLECSLDSAAYTACTSPKSYINLSEGSHTFSVKATDAAGNTDASPASTTWTVDTTAPETTIDSGPSGTITVAEATFAFSSEEGAHFECRLDGAAYSACTSPKSFTNLSNNSHTFDVRATDEAGNVDATPASRTFSVEAPPPPQDTTPPETTIDSGPSGTVSTSSASFAFSSSDEAGSTFQCQLDPLEWASASCTSPKAYSGLMAGTEYTFSVWATDASGNTDATPATSTFTPLETVTNVRDFGATGNGTSNDTAAFKSAMAQASQTGQSVYVPAPGTYRIAGVNPPNNTHLQVQSGAVLKKYGTTNGPLFNVLGPNDTTFATNIHMEGVDGNFTIDLNDASQQTDDGIIYRNVRNFSLKNMVCIQNNDNPTQEAPSSRATCVTFLPKTQTPTNGVYNHPTDGTFENIHSKESPYGWGLTQISGGENLHFTNISSEGGVPLRVESYARNWTPMDNIVADGVTCKNGHDAVHMNPHGATHGTVTVRNVVADSCESALSIKTDAQLGGSYASDSSIDSVTVIPGDQAQLRDPAPGGYVGAWIIGPSQWCVDSRDNLGYTIGLSNLDCGGLSSRP